MPPDFTRLTTIFSSEILIALSLLHTRRRIHGDYTSTATKAYTSSLGCWKSQHRHGRCGCNSRRASALLEHLVHIPATKFHRNHPLFGVQRWKTHRPSHPQPNSGDLRRVYSSWMAHWRRSGRYETAKISSRRNSCSCVVKYLNTPWIGWQEKRSGQQPC